MTIHLLEARAEVVESSWDRLSKIVARSHWRGPFAWTTAYWDGKQNMCCMTIELFERFCSFVPTPGVCFRVRQFRLMVSKVNRSNDTLDCVRLSSPTEEGLVQVGLMLWDWVTSLAGSVHRWWVSKAGE